MRNVLPPFAAREFPVAHPRHYSGGGLGGACRPPASPCETPARWLRRADFFLAPSIEGDTIVIFFSGGPGRFRRHLAAKRAFPSQSIGSRYYFAIWNSLVLRLRPPPRRNEKKGMSEMTDLLRAMSRNQSVPAGGCESYSDSQWFDTRDLL